MVWAFTWCDTLLLQLWLFNLVFQNERRESYKYFKYRRLSLDNVNISDEVNRLVKMDKDEHQFLPGPSRKGETELCKIKKNWYLRNFFCMLKRFWIYLKIQMPFSEDACFTIIIYVQPSAGLQLDKNTGLRVGIWKGKGEGSMRVGAGQQPQWNQSLTDDKAFKKV